MRFLWMWLVLIPGLLEAQTGADKVSIQWKDSVPGDYSFSREWSYNVNVFRNQKGQLVCDGFCDPQLEKLRTKDGIIPVKNRKAYYAAFDTSHFQCNAVISSTMPEFIGSRFFAIRNTGDTFFLKTHGDPANHSWLELTLMGDSVKCNTRLLSISSDKNRHYEFLRGTVELDKNQYARRQLRGKFYLVFRESESGKHMAWEGRMDGKLPEKGKSIPAPGFNLGQ
ncbi:MAG: hypothetical protein JNL57_10485 [Bacteroidetes bacterium]|nr:hypothetical protein [Bacteroidota bacterium]